MFLRLEDVIKLLVGEWSCTVDGLQIDINNEEEMNKDDLSS